MEFEVGSDQRANGVNFMQQSISQGGEASCPTEDVQLGFGERGQQPRWAGLAGGSCESRVLWVQQTEQLLAQPSRSAPGVKSPSGDIAVRVWQMQIPTTRKQKVNAGIFRHVVPASHTFTSGCSETDSLDLTLGQ